MMSRMYLVSSSCVCVVVVFLLCLISHECNGRHLTSIDDQHVINDDKAKLLISHSTMKGFEKDPVLTVDDDDRKLTADSGSKKKKGMIIKDQSTVKKFKKEVAVHGHPKGSTTSRTYRVPSKKKRVDDQQPGFNLDYSPPKTHPPSHN